MRELLLTILIPSAMIWGLFSAPGSVLMLNWIWFQRPYDFSWGMWSSLPLFQIGVMITLFSNAVRRQLRFKVSGILVIYLLLLCWITLSTFMAFNTDVAWLTYTTFMPSMWVAPILMYATINDLNLLRKVFWVAAGGLGLNAFKVGVSMTVKGGGALTDQISGFVGDNNVFGLVLCLVVAALMGLKSTLPKRRWALPAFYAFITFIILCIIYTKSRGALLSLVIIMFLRAVISTRPARNSIILAAVLWLGYAVVPASYFDRLDTLKDVGADVSAMGRVENWGLAWNEAVTHPLTGVGPNNHLSYNRSIVHDVQVRVAHSVYFQVLGELGFPGLALYLLFVLTSLGMLMSTWRFMIPVAREHPDLAWARDLASWLTCGYIGYVIGSGLLNMLYIEFPWYIPFYGSMLRPLVRKELAERLLQKNKSAPLTAGGTPVVVAHPQ